MQVDFMDTLQDIRNVFGKPMVVSSGYRSPLHSVERKKKRSGAHTYGVAVDILVHGDDVRELIVIASGFGIRRIGVSQNGAKNKRFVHLDIGDRDLAYPVGFWSY